MSNLSNVTKTILILLQINVVIIKIKKRGISKRFTGSNNNNGNNS